MERVVYTVTARSRAGHVTDRMWLLIGNDGVATRWKSREMISVLMSDRCAAKDLAWQLLIHPDCDTVSVQDELYDPELIPPAKLPS